MLIPVVVAVMLTTEPEADAVTGEEITFCALAATVARCVTLGVADRILSSVYSENEGAAVKRRDRIGPPVKAEPDGEMENDACEKSLVS